MSGAGVEQLLYLVDEAFGGEDWHSLMGNLRTVRDEDWLWVPPGGARRIVDLVRHVGECKYVYENHAWGDASMRWDRPGTVPTFADSDRKPAVIEWLREGHRRLRDRLSALDDEE